MFYCITEEQLHSKVSGKNKAFITRTINKQKKYGNYNIFECYVDTEEETIRIVLGESQGIFKKDWHTDKWERDYGNLYNIPECTAIVNEIAKQYFEVKGE